MQDAILFIIIIDEDYNNEKNVNEYIGNLMAILSLRVRVYVNMKSLYPLLYNPTIIKSLRKFPK